MTTRQIHALLERADVLLGELPADVREPIDGILTRLLGAYLKKAEEVGHLRRWQASDAHERLFRRLTEASPQ